MVFTIDGELEENIAAWQHAQLEQLCAENGGVMPYEGAIGGLWSYIITPTSIGLMVKVVNNLNKQEFSGSDV